MRTLLLSLLLLLGTLSTTSAELIVDLASSRDIAIGQADAPTTLIVYSSPTCSHCIDFDRRILPELERRYVSQGKLRVVIRPFLRNSIDAVILMIVDRAEHDGRKSLLDTFAKNYEKIMASEDREQTLRAISLDAGVDKAAFDAAVKDERLLDDLNRITSQAVSDRGVKGTPSFFLGERKLEYDGSIKTFEKELGQLAE